MLGKDIRKDFKMLDNKMMQGNPFIYFDNAATSLKPLEVIEAMNDYYFNYNSNVHRGDYDIAALADKAYEEARKNIASFIGANEKEIIFTSGATQALNLVAYSYGLANLKKDDEIILNVAEHASNILPWLEIAKQVEAKIIYVELTSDGEVTVENLKKVISKNTKIISLAYVSNVIGYKNDIKAICKLAHENNIIVNVDGAQAVPHLAIDVKDLDVDFLSFSAHKMCGPTGIGALYGKYELLEKMNPMQFGGGMNTKFNKENCQYKQAPYKFEAGTPAIAEVIGFSAAVNYLKKQGMANIEAYEKELKEYAINKLSKLDNITIYNKNSSSGIIAFNIKNVFCQDAGSYFNYKGIAVRSGHHCAKLLPEFTGTIGTVRASFYFYNTKDEIDKFVDACSHGGEFLDAFFK